MAQHYVLHITMDLSAPRYPRVSVRQVIHLLHFFCSIRLEKTHLFEISKKMGWLVVVPCRLVYGNHILMARPTLSSCKN